MFDGRIVAAGATYSPDSPGSFALAWYNNTDDRFDVHLQGETSGRSLGLNSMTGEGLFADWGSGYTLAGTGRLRVRGCKINMEDRGADYTLSAKVNHCALAGKTTLQL
jgi:hypothetical protein